MANTTYTAQYDITIKGTRGNPWRYTDLPSMCVRALPFEHGERYQWNFSRKDENTLVFSTLNQETARTALSVFSQVQHIEVSDIVEREWVTPEYERK